MADAPTGATRSGKGPPLAGTLKDAIPSGPRISLALTLLRVILGIVFVMHGGQKLFVFGLAGVIGSFAEQGMPAAPFVAPAVSFIEFFGGLAMIAGFLTRPAAVGLAVVMVGAISTVHVPHGFFAPMGIEFPLVLLTIAVVMLITGPGPYSVDAFQARRRES